jgi:hypothetical protein
MPSAVRCYCLSYKCKGALVAYPTKRTHERADLRLKTSSSQSLHRGNIIPHVPVDPPRLVMPYPPRGPILPPRFEFPDPPASSSCAVEQEMLDHGTLTQEDIDIQVHGNELPNLRPAFHSPEALLDAVEHFTEHNALTASGAQPLTSYHAHNLLRDPEQRAIQREFERTMEEIQSQQEELLNDLDIDIDNEIDIDANMALDEDFEASQDLAPATPASDGEDNPDPFKPDEDLVSSVRASGNDQHLSSQPLYLVTIYALATWLHLQWHLPRAACNALLSILSCLLIAICPTIVPPFVTLHSATKVLGLDMPTFELPCCPSCREVYPASGSLHTQDTCIPCQVPLFLPDKTMRSNKRTKKIPFIKYPYLPISMQLHSILMIPGIENILDQWRTKPRARGQYTDIFDGDICRLKLKAPDGSLFFSNLPHEKQGPAGELRIGLNMGLDWCVCHKPSCGRR